MGAFKRAQIAFDEQSESFSPCYDCTNSECQGCVDETPEPTEDDGSDRGDYLYEQEKDRRLGL